MGDMKEENAGFSVYDIDVGRAGGKPEDMSTGNCGCISQCLGHPDDGPVSLLSCSFDGMVSHHCLALGDRKLVVGDIWVFLLRSCQHRS